MREERVRASQDRWCVCFVLYPLRMGVLKRYGYRAKSTTKGMTHLYSFSISYLSIDEQRITPSSYSSSSLSLIAKGRLVIGVGVKRSNFSENSAQLSGRYTQSPMSEGLMPFSLRGMIIIHKQWVGIDTISVYK